MTWQGVVDIMQNFSLNDKADKPKDIKKDSVDIKVSGVFERDGKKMAYVSFSDGLRYAEGIIPDCVITSNKGFGEDETTQLEAYMKEELETLKKTASGINVVKALIDK